MILDFPDCSFFHGSAWAQVLRGAYGYKPLYFTICNGDEVHACLPVMEVDSIITGRRGISLPFTDFCEPLVSSPRQFEELLGGAVEYGEKRGWKFLEMRGGGFFLDGNPPSFTYLLHSLKLTDDEEKTFSRFRESNRRNIRKSREFGVRVQILTTEESVRQFYKLNQRTRKEHGLPPQPYRFFEKVHEHVISKGYGFIAAAVHGDAVIAASVYFHLGKAGVYKYGASNRRYQHLRPNNLVMWEAIRWYIRNGYTSLSFGRTDLDHAGLRQFKAGWGATERLISYYRYGVGTGRFMTNGSGKTKGITSKAMSLAPLSLLKAVGSFLYKHMG
jgi:hypothetical protein